MSERAAGFRRLTDADIREIMNSDDAEYYIRGRVASPINPTPDQMAAMCDFVERVGLLTIEQVVAIYCNEAIRRTGSRTEAAKVLGTSRHTVGRRARGLTR